MQCLVWTLGPRRSRVLVGCRCASGVARPGLAKMLLMEVWRRSPWVAWWSVLIGLAVVQIPPEGWLIELACWLSDLWVQWEGVCWSTMGACVVGSRIGLVGLVRGWRGHCFVGTRKGHHSRSRVLH